MAFEHQKIKTYEHWTLYLHENQCYLGRTYLWANRLDAVDFIETTWDEQNEFFKIATELKSVLNQLFNPDIYNYSSLGNISNHLHLHIIPRYSDIRKFKEFTFIDKQWGKNYSPYDATFDIGESRFFDLKTTLKDKLDQY
jgi:diadenosine tetraphosphate (Ap4A) HIT family hydrolase